MPPVIDKENCNRCGRCVDICPTDVYWGSIGGELPIVMYPGECWHCDACVVECPQEVIRLRIPLPMVIPAK